MVISRDLDWDGCCNVRDLGGLPTRSGTPLRSGAVVRSDHPSFLTDAGWQSLRDYGIRTIVSLQTEIDDAETYARINPDVPPERLTDGISQVRIAVEDCTDIEYLRLWADTSLWSTPLYFSDAYSRWPQRYAAALRAVATAPPGGVLVHCRAGCDRTGSVALLLLAACDVEPAPIVADYLHSGSRYSHHDPDYPVTLQAAMDKAGTTAEQVVHDTLAGLDVVDYLRGGGLTDAELDALRERLR
ncbi:MAG: tyrosine-protein phosphatase [Jatrophihabitans sp.]